MPDHRDLLLVREEVSKEVELAIHKILDKFPDAYWDIADIMIAAGIGIWLTHDMTEDAVFRKLRDFYNMCLQSSAEARQWIQDNRGTDAA